MAAQAFVFPKKPRDEDLLKTDDIEIQLLPQSKREKECVKLEAGQSVTIDGKTDEVVLNFDWSYKPEIPEFDLDSAVALFRQDFSTMEYIWWDRNSSSDGTLHFQSPPANDAKESIRIQLEKLSDEVAYILTAVSVYSKDHEMRHVDSITLKVEDESKKPLLEYKVAGKEGRSLLMGTFVRKGDDWEFMAMAEPLMCRTITEIISQPSGLNSVREVKPSPKIRKRVTLWVSEGKDLTPMDFTILAKRSDPYVKIFYDDKVVKSEVTLKTLNPKFICPEIDLGIVNEKSNKVIEIQCWDWDEFTDDDDMGVLRLSLGGLMSQVKKGENIFWLKLYPTSEQADKKVKISGHLCVKVRVEEII